MLKYLTCSLLVLLCCFAFPELRAQKKPGVHSPAELLKILEDSRLTYEIELMDSTFPCRDRSDLLTDNHTFPSTGPNSANGYELYRLKEAEQALLDSAERHYRKKELTEARSVYGELVKLRPDFGPALTYIGQTYEMREDYSTAIKYLERAVAANFYDYLAHYFLADNYARIGNHSRAADEIVLASILNRNNPNIRKAMLRILPKAGYRAPQWCFEPQVLIMRKDDTHITMRAADNWLGYAIAKAVWKFEPGYRAANGGAPEGSYNLAEDKECLVSLAVGLGADTARGWKGQPELEALSKAVDSSMFMEYLYYEVMLPKFPKAVYQLPREGLEDIRKYVLQVRAQ